MARKIRNLPSQQELDQDWYPNKPGQDVDARLRRIIGKTNNVQYRLLKMHNEQQEQTTEVKKPNFTTIHALKKGTWQTVGYRCMECGKVINDTNIIEKHPLICTYGLKINNEEENDMPIQRVMKGETPYYRYGTHGKLYRTKQEAEQQMRAMFAAGYKQPKKENK